MSRIQHKRILRGDDGVVASAASLLVHVPAGRQASRGSAGLDDVIEQSRRKGHEEGYQAALDEIAAAEATGRSAQLRRIADALVEAAAEVGRTREEAVALGAAEATELAYELAQAFLQRELTIGRPAVEAVTRALQLVPEDVDLVVHLNPHDVVQPEELQELVPDAAVKVVTDPRVEEGGCLVVAGPCRIDVQMGPALERARRVLAGLYPDEGCAAAEALA